MKDLQAYLNKIDTALRSWELPGAPNNLYDPLRYFMTLGGKRIRPVFTALGAELYGVSEEEYLPVALAVEMFHNFTLVHDDIMDKAPLRRGKPTVHEKWNHDIALLSGDVMLVKAYQLLGTHKGNHLGELLDLFNKTAVEVCEGQQLDMDFEQRKDVTVDAYMGMIRLKTSVLLGSAIEMGAILGHAQKEDRQNLYAFGENIGLAFQIQDDILDLYADAAIFGKQVGGDVIANKKTLLSLLAYQHATSEQRVRLEALSVLDHAELKVIQTREIYNEIGAKALCEKEMLEHHNKALVALTSVHLPEEQKQKLKDLADFLLIRNV
jgi:geranylgeranyl diphosphate synthase type II